MHLQHAPFQHFNVERARGGARNQRIGLSRIRAEDHSGDSTNARDGMQQRAFVVDADLGLTRQRERA